MGNIETDTYIKLCSWDYFVQKWPKSLGAEAIENEFIPLFHYHSSVEDNLRTAVECFAEKIAQIINEQTISNVLVTGGGAYNNFFIQRLQALTPSKIEIPHSSIVDFKEALIFAFLGYLRLHQKANTMSSVTGALSNSAGGCVYFHQ
jgi:anhydro-N-acetylmuramic acid kinase